MQLSVHGKQIDVGDSLRTHVTEKLEDLNSKYFNHATDATITFSKEGHGHALTRTHVSIRIGKNIMVMADSVEGDPYASFDAAAEKVAKQLRRYKTRLKDHHDRQEQTPELESLKARDYILATEQNDEQQESGDVQSSNSGDPVVIAEMVTDIETLTVSDAVMRMDLAGLSALLFRNASHNGLNMIYRRPDGNVGWIDPEGNNDAEKKSA